MKESTDPGISDSDLDICKQIQDDFVNCSMLDSSEEDMQSITCLTFSDKNHPTLFSQRLQKLES